MGSSSSRSFSPNKLCGADSAISKPPRMKRNMGNIVSSDYVEATVCKETDLKENEMKVFDLGDDGRVLLVKQKGEITALGTKCSHYGAPLVNGALGDGRIRCPWHGACFNIRTGDIEDFPGLNSIPCYQVNVGDDGNVKVRAKKSELQNNAREKELMQRSNGDSSTFVVIGGGPSAATCVETLRGQGYVGRLLMITKEAFLPYDRIKLSKLGISTDISKLQFRNEEFYTKYNIEVIKNCEAIKVDTKTSKVSLSNGETLDYTALYLATGSRARKPNMPGVDFKNVFTVRELADTINIVDAIGDNKDKDVVILGLSFIGLETAASCVDKAKSVTAIGRDTEPLGSIFGTEIGAALRKLFESKGIKFVFKSSVTEVNGDDGIIKSVTLTDGTVLPADVFIMGVGTEYNTEFLRGSGIVMEMNGSVHVNNKMETNIPNVYAGGDIAFAPVFAYGNRKAAIGHIGLSQYHGKMAALNMLKKNEEMRSVPFFWTQVFGKSIRYSGYGKHTSVRVDGNIEELKFVVFFFDEEDKVIAVAACQRDPIVSQFAEYLAQGRTISKADLDKDLYGWTKDINLCDCFDDQNK